MINKELLELVYEPKSAVSFMESCPLTMGGLKNLFLVDKSKELGTSIEEYEEYLSKEDLYDEEDNLFNYLNDKGLSDEEVIEEILENEPDEYFIDYVNDEDLEDSYWKIYKIVKPFKETIEVPIYFYQDYDKIVIDEESIYKELESKLEEIKENPTKFLEVEE